MDEQDKPAFLRRTESPSTLALLARIRERAAREMSALYWPDDEIDAETDDIIRRGEDELARRGE